ncbi:hypothetical protein [Actinokineospora diospyrosa]|uniref:PH (Pleckstrin Homology) domain-containing protein n=1 Tax=Actinokineospora diospyrosa TaxID=103728 RepID=A0ABT1IBE6_9PSEU|nr:hypothetical protein [Actinokineospora diospyrosa]MCP2269886.1 hypothetical protein [Actinokineospora diospyrosa]
MSLEPVLTRSALSDPTTATLHALRRALDWRKVLPLVNVVLAAVVAWYGNHALGSTAVTGLLLVLGAVSLAQGVYALRVRQISLRNVGMLREQPWTSVDIQVLRGTTGITDLRVEGATTALRVFSLTAAHRAVLRRTGRAWLVGPDAEGVAAIRVEGSHEAWPARVLSTVPAQRPVPAPDKVEPTARAAAVRSKRITMALVFLPVFLLYALYTATMFGGFELLLFLIGLTPALLVGLLLVAIRHRLADRRLPALVRAGGWVQVEATVHSRAQRADATAEAHITLRRADGSAVAVVSRNAPVDLLGAITDTGVVWVAGTVETGQTIALGFPGYPLVAAAKVTG